MLAKADHFARQHHFTHQSPHIAEAQVLALCGKGMSVQRCGLPRGLSSS